jgi:hypothetical protein
MTMIDTPPLLDDLEWALFETENIPCDFLLRNPQRKCPQKGKYRVRVDCRSCKHNKGILWACQTHFDWLRDGKLGCGHCGGGYDKIRWELL